MKVLFATRKVQNALATMAARQRIYGPDAAKTLAIRLANLEDAATLADFRYLPGHCHELMGNRTGQLALTVTKGLRLIIAPGDEPVPLLSEGSLDWAAVTIVRILEVTDYHG